MQSKLGHRATGGACGCRSIEHYDPEPPGYANILDQLVAALCDTGLEGNPQCPRK